MSELRYNPGILMASFLSIIIECPTGKIEKKMKKCKKAGCLPTAKCLRETTGYELVLSRYPGHVSFFDFRRCSSVLFYLWLCLLFDSYRIGRSRYYIGSENWLMFSSFNFTIACTFYTSVYSATFSVVLVRQ